MHGRRACRLVKEFNSGEKGQLNHFNEELLNEVAKECSENFLVLQSLIRKMQEEGLDFQTRRNADHYGALINHLSLIRNKRCLMAYVYNRAEMIQNLAWTVGLRLFELPEEIQEKLSHPEKEYFKKHSTSSSCLTDIKDSYYCFWQDMVPPKDPYIKVRVLDDVGEGIVVSDKAANFARHSMHFLKRTDAELYISRGLMEELIG
ncbi:hypothetical protein EZV62_004206 [Acer yangbiense]|uniref:Uncharacterized protein n=1 Tax=Acer yangbiense TaxID=1000413 RepID=A0A5C7IJD8_9ROSI|nr:hypothetical protein EZV62_004206 [Acer yangbiense]